MFSRRASSSMSQLDLVTWSPAGGSSPVNSGGSSSLPTLSRQTSSLGTDISSPYSSGTWPSQPGLDNFSWIQDDLTLFAGDDLGVWPIIPIEEGYAPLSNFYTPPNSSYNFSGQTFDSTLPTSDGQDFASAFQTAQFAADLLQFSNTSTPSRSESPLAKKVSISRTKAPSKDKKRNQCPDCSKSFIRPSDLVRHKQDVHANAEFYYQCEERSCTYNARRKDKMKEHCRKMHNHEPRSETFATVNAKERAFDDGSPLAKRQRR